MNSVLASKVLTRMSSALIDSPLGVMTSERSNGFFFSSCRFTLRKEKNEKVERVDWSYFLVHE